MAEYRAYAIGADGHFVSWKPLICKDDSEAIERAGKCFEGQPVELWCRERLIVRLPPER